jgi:hypothetical protein
LYATNPVLNVNVRKEMFALNPTTISLSLKPFSWAPGKYSGHICFDKPPLKELLTECQINQSVNEQWNLFDE